MQKNCIYYLNRYAKTVHEVLKNNEKRDRIDNLRRQRKMIKKSIQMYTGSLITSFIVQLS